MKCSNRSVLIIQTGFKIRGAVQENLGEPWCWGRKIFKLLLTKFCLKISKKLQEIFIFEILAQPPCSASTIFDGL